MPKTQYFTAASLDGFIADSGNSLDWLFQAEATAKAESASGDLYHEFYAQVGALAMGATTYEWVLRHEKLLDKPGSWPYAGGAAGSSATASCPPCLVPTSAVVAQMFSSHVSPWSLTSPGLPASLRVSTVTSTMA